MPNGTQRLVYDLRFESVDLATAVKGPLARLLFALALGILFRFLGRVSHHHGSQSPTHPTRV